MELLPFRNQLNSLSPGKEMKKINFYLVIFIFAFSLSIEGASKDQIPVTQTSNSSTKKGMDKYKMIERDEIDNTSTLAIPFDDSEIEDEEQIDRAEGKDLFDLPYREK